MLGIERCKGDGDEADEHDIETIEGDHVLDPGSHLRVHLEADSTGICLQSQLLRIPNSRPALNLTKTLPPDTVKKRESAESVIQWWSTCL